MKFKGFVLIHRNIKNWEWYDHPPTRLIFEHCLYSANYEDENWRGQIIKRGQFPTSIEKLAIANGLTNQQTRTALKNLQTTNEINIQTTNKYSIITVLNWDLYQPNQQTKNIPKQQTNNMQPNKQIGGSNNNTTINKEINKNNIISLSSSIDKNKIEISEDEREFLKKYAKKNGAKYINPYIRKLIANGDAEDILKNYRLTKKNKETAPPEKIEEIKESKEISDAAFEECKKAVNKIRKGN